MPWAYYQAAPPDQQIEYLRGDEWLVLDGLHPTLSRVQTRLASVRGAARVSGTQAGASAPFETPVELVCDTLAIDGDRQTFSLVWRGRVDVAHLDAITVAAALEAPGVPVDWVRIGNEAATVAPTVPDRSRVPLNLRGTELTVEPKGPALPFQKNASAAAVLARLPSSSRPPQKSFGGTALALSDLPPRDRPHMPFAPTGPREAPSIAQAPPPVAAESAAMEGAKLEAPTPPSPLAPPASEPEDAPIAASPAAPPWRQDPEPAAPPPDAAPPPAPPPPPTLAGPPPVSAQVKKGVYGRFGR
jgi:hypothetical protein